MMVQTCLLGALLCPFLMSPVFAKEIEDSNITIAVERALYVRDRIATLVGTVDAWKERVATDNSYEGGAKKVRNELTVRHGPEYFAP